MNTMQFANLVGRTTLGIDSSWVEYTMLEDHAVVFRIGVTKGTVSQIRNQKGSYDTLHC